MCSPGASPAPRTRHCGRTVRRAGWRGGGSASVGWPRRDQPCAPPMRCPALRSVPGSGGYDGQRCLACGREQLRRPPLPPPPSPSPRASPRPSSNALHHQVPPRMRTKMTRGLAVGWACAHLSGWLHMDDLWAPSVPLTSSARTSTPSRPEMRREHVGHGQGRARCRPAASSIALIGAAACRRCRRGRCAAQPPRRPLRHLRQRCLSSAVGSSRRGLLYSWARRLPPASLLRGRCPLWWPGWGSARGMDMCPVATRSRPPLLLSPFGERACLCGAKPRGECSVSAAPCLLGGLVSGGGYVRRIRQQPTPPRGGAEVPGSGPGRDRVETNPSRRAKLNMPDRGAPSGRTIARHARSSAQELEQALQRQL